MTNSKTNSPGVVSILFFGQLAEQVGRTRLEVAADLAPDVEALLRYVRAEFHPLRTATFAVAVDEQIRNANVPLAAGMTVALLPPFSGG